jgi:hypothetical protein
VASSSSTLLLLYELFGTESIRLEEGQLAVNRSLFGFNKMRFYDIALMRNLQVISRTYWYESSDAGRRTRGYVIRKGRISFAYRDKTCEVGANLTDDEAFNVVHQIRSQISKLSQ